MSENNMTYYQGDNVPHPDRARDEEPHVSSLSLVPDNKWRIGTFDVSLAFF